MAAPYRKSYINRVMMWIADKSKIHKQMHTHTLTHGLSLSLSLTHDKRNHLVPINTYLSDFIANQSHIERLTIIYIWKRLKSNFLFFFSPYQSWIFGEFCAFSTYLISNCSKTPFRIFVYIYKRRNFSCSLFILLHSELVFLKIPSAWIVFLLKYKTDANAFNSFEAA